MSKLSTNIKLLIEAENQAIIEAVADGRKDPFNLENEADQRSAMIIDNLDGTFSRRFIEVYGEVKFDSLNKSNVRIGEVDEEHCTNRMKPWLRNDKKILYPPFTTRSGAGTQEDIESGHHRIHTSNQLWPLRLIPRFRLGNEVFECDKNGNILNSKAVDLATRLMSEHKSRVQCNPPSMHKSYTMKDRAQQVYTAVKIDPTLGGLIEDGHVLENNKADRALWDIIAAKWIPGQFEAEDGSERTKMFNLFLKMSPSKIKNVEESDISQMLGTLGYGTPSNGNRKRRKAFLKSYCPDSNCLYFVIDTNGRNLQHKVEALFNGAFWDGKFSGYPAGLSIRGVLTIYNPSNNLIELNKERDAAIAVCENINRHFIQSGIKISGKSVLIKEVAFPTQLSKDPNDIGRTVVLHKPNDVEEGTVGRIGQVKTRTSKVTMESTIH